MLVQRTKVKKVFWEFDSIIVQNMSHNLLLFCAPTWPSYHVNENHLLPNPFETKLRALTITGAMMNTFLMFHNLIASHFRSNICLLSVFLYQQLLL